MESVDLDMNDLFDHDGEEDQDYGMNAGLPDLDLEETVNEPHDDQQQEHNEDDEVLANLKNLSKGAAKKKVQRPQPKLNSERLQSDRGLPALLKLFGDTKFRGKGHEVEDLKLLMSKLEHWAHRLFPKMSFDDFIERLEKLGAKKEIQTCVKRIRLDMPISGHDDIEHHSQEADEPDNILLNESDDEDVMSAADRVFGTMIETEHWMQDMNSICTDNSTSPVKNSTSPTHLPSTSMTHSPSLPPLQSSSSIQKASEVSVTPEQRQRMENNRLLALQKRTQRLGNLLPTSQ